MTSLNLFTSTPKSIKPDCNRMVAEKLGTTTCGCNCQSMILLLIQNGEIKAWESTTPVPCHLVDLEIDNTKKAYNSYLKDGEGIYTEPMRGSSYLVNLDNKIDEFGEPAHYIETIKFGDKYFEKQHCPVFDEATSNLFDDYNCPDELQKLPTGIYRLLIEHACFSDGYEGDSDYDYKLYTDIPLYYYWKYKDELIAEADYEAEELASTYIYLREINKLNY